MKAELIAHGLGYRLSQDQRNVLLALRGAGQLDLHCDVTRAGTIARVSDRSGHVYDVGRAGDLTIINLPGAD